MNKEPTCVSLVYDVLVGSDDFKTPKQLVDETRCTMHQILSATYHLHRYRAVQMLVTDGTTYWYATPDTDNRQHIMPSRKIEDKPRKIRIKKQKT